jgi:hypothetical protein
MTQRLRSSDPSALSDTELARAIRTSILMAECFLDERQRQKAGDELRWLRALNNERERRGMQPPLFAG